MPRELHRKAADARAARDRLPRGRRRRGRRPARQHRRAGGDVRGGSVQRADGGAVHQRDRAPAHGGERRPEPRRPVRPADAGRRADRQRWPSPSRAAAPTSPASGPRHERDGDDYVVDGDQDLHHQRGARRLRDHRGAHGRAGPRAASACSWSRRARPASPSTARLATMGWHCSDTAELGFAEVRVPAANLVGAEGTGFAQIAGAVRRRADRAGRPRLRHRGPQPGADGGVLPGAARRSASPWSANQVVRHRLVEMHRQVEVGPQPTPTRSPRGTSPGRTWSPRPAWRSRPRSRLRRTSATRPCSCTAAAGYLHGTEVERHYRDARILPIGGGATEVLTDLTARLLGYAP